MPFHISWQCLVLFSVFISSQTQTVYDWNATETLIRSLGYCPWPSALDNGEFVGNKVNRGALLQFRCFRGYHLIGPSEFRCEPDDEHYLSTLRDRRKLAWSPDFTKTRCEASPRTTTMEPAPVLVQSICSLRLPLNPHVRIRDWRQSYPVNSGVMYTCERGYVAVGGEARWCIPGGRWLPEEDPECMDEDLLTSEPPTVHSSIETWSIMKIILYISIPLLVVFVLTVVCNLRKQVSKRSRQARTRSSTEGNDTTYPQLLPTRATGDSGLVAHPYYQTGTTPTAPPPDLLNSGYYALPITVTADSPGHVIQEPPSYEEATRDSTLPSFEVAQKLHNSRENLQ